MKHSISILFLLLCYCISGTPFADEVSPFTINTFSNTSFWTGQFKWKKPEKVKTGPGLIPVKWPKPYKIVTVKVSGGWLHNKQRFVVNIDTYGDYVSEGEDRSTISQVVSCIGLMDETRRSEDGLTIYLAPVENSGCGDGVNLATLTAIDVDKIRLVAYKGERELVSGIIRAQSRSQMLSMESKKEQIQTSDNSVSTSKDEEFPSKWTTALLGNWRGKFLDEEIELSVWIPDTSQGPDIALDAFVRTMDGACEYLANGLSMTPKRHDIPVRTEDSRRLHLHYRILPDATGLYTNSKGKDLSSAVTSQERRRCDERVQQFNVFYDDVSGNVFMQATANYKPEDGRKYHKHVKLVRSNASKGMLALIRRGARSDHRQNPSPAEMSLIRDASLHFEDVRDKVAVSCYSDYKYADTRLREIGLESIKVSVIDDKKVEVETTTLEEHLTPVRSIQAKIPGVDWDNVYVSGRGNRKSARTEETCKQARAVLQYLSALKADKLKIVTAPRKVAKKITSSWENAKAVKRDYYTIRGNLIITTKKGYEKGVRHICYGLPRDLRHRLRPDSANHISEQEVVELVGKKYPGFGVKGLGSIYSVKEKGVLSWADVLDSKKLHAGKYDDYPVICGTPNEKYGAIVDEYFVQNTKNKSLREVVMLYQLGIPCRDKPFCDLPGGRYLNAIYENNRNDINRINSKKHTQFKSLGNQLVARMGIGSDRVTDSLIGLSNPNLLELVTNKYMHDYKYMPEKCFKPGARSVRKYYVEPTVITIDEWGGVTRQEGSYTEAIYRVNPEFNSLLDKLGTAWGAGSSSNMRPGVGDITLVIFQGLEKMRSKYNCNSSEVERFERNLIALTERHLQR